MSWIALTEGFQNEALYMGLEPGDEVIALKTHREKERKRLTDPDTWEASSHTDVFRVFITHRDWLLVRHARSDKLRNLTWAQVLGFRKAGQAPVPTIQNKS